MKNVIALILVSFLAVNSYAQQEEVEMKTVKESTEDDGPKGGFKKDHLFIGGGIQFSFSNYDFVIGGSPVIGYSINKWVDIGIGLNVTYISEKEVQYDAYGDLRATGNKIHQTDIAPIAFARFYPLKFLFIQAQGEQNFISQKYISGYGQPALKANYDATSLLLGVGYASGREGVGNFFYYVSLSVDVLKNRYSPYVQQALNGSVNMLPILRAGIQVPLFQGKRNR
ncbi:MAG: hypothetical protein ABI741_09490 [Ferruginibacter sp.]